MFAETFEVSGQEYHGHHALRPAYWKWWHRTALFVVIGYLIMGRSFSYLGFAPLKIFIGELVLVAFFLLRPREGIDRIYHALGHQSLLKDCSWALVALLFYGGFEVFRGSFAGYSVLTALQCMVFNYYPLYLLFGIWIGENDPEFIERLIVRLAWWNGIYGTLYLTFLSRISIAFPGAQNADLSLFGQPWGSPIALLGLLCLKKPLKKSWLPLLLNVVTLLGLQVRAEWASFAVGLIAYSVLTRSSKRLILGTALTGLCLGFGFVADIRIPGPPSRGGMTISSREIVGRALAPISPSLAAEFTEGAAAHASTATWRTGWWKAIWENNQTNTETLLLGGGYGYPLISVVPYLRGWDTTRTPHNMFFFALGYGGWILVGLFAFLQWFVFRLLLKAYRFSKNPFGLVFWYAVIVWSLFGDSFETPYGAIPFFVTTGAVIGPFHGLRRLSLGSMRRYMTTRQPAYLEPSR